jgi:phosphatidylserine/phosphatidylglycerophosphate/cardiolipin synthase-like enzyme
VLDVKLSIVLLLLVVVAATATWQLLKPLPPGLSFRGQVHPLWSARVLHDVTWQDASGEQQLDHEIFDEVLRLIGQARQLVVVDMFLFNDSAPPGGDYRPLAQQLTQALVARKQALENIAIVVISDPFNTLYGGTPSVHFDQLREAGIAVVETPLSPLRDSNPLWSGPWRLCCQWLGNSADGGWLPSFIGSDQVTLRSYLSLLNFKANHRKTLVVDEGEGLRGLITSANPHAGSSRHSNIGLSFAGPAVLELLQSELAVLAMAGVKVELPALSPGPPPATESPEQGQILSEGKIRTAVLAMIDGAPAGSRLDLSMFYLSHREVVAAFKRAHRRGVGVRVLLDANKDAFGRKKNGIPNRQVALELHRAGIPVRWCNTHGEQCHSKVLIRRDPQGAWQFLLGSANLTRRNLDDFNLETNIRVWGGSETALSRAIAANFDAYWGLGAAESRDLSLPYQAYADPSPWRYWRYRVMEGTGLSTF